MQCYKLNILANTILAYIFSKEGSSLNWKVFASWTSMPSSWSNEPLDNIFDIRSSKRFQRSNDTGFASLRSSLQTNAWRENDVEFPSDFAICKHDHHPLRNKNTQPPSLPVKPVQTWIGLLEDSGVTMSIGRVVYNALFRRTSTFAVTMVVGAFAFERVFDVGVDNFWESLNRGVSCNCL